MLRLRRMPLAQLRLRALLKPSQSKPYGFASSPEGGAFLHLTVPSHEAPPSGELARKRLRGSLFIPDGHAAGVGVQALALGKIGDAGGYFAQRFPGVVEEAGLFYKVVYAQGA